MLYRTDFDENGRKTLCQMDGSTPICLWTSLCKSWRPATP